MNTKSYTYFLTVIFTLTVFYSFGQFPTPQTPTFQQFQTITPRQQSNPQQDQINRQQPQTTQRQIVDDFHKDLHEAEPNRTINYNFPSLQKLPQVATFHNAFAVLDSMVHGQQPINLKKAVYTIENAYLDNKLSYTKFNSQIKSIVDVCKHKIQIDKVKPTNNEALNMIIYQVLCDTIDVQNPKTKVFYKSYPYTYDFIDFWGYKDYTKQFVSKLLKTRSGQCRSLPLLYLIIAEELNTEAYLTFSPSHTFVRFKLNNGKWQNVELTNGRLSSDAWVLGSGFIKSEALTSKIYLDTINRKQHIAALMADLAAEYIEKVGFDDYILKMLNRSLEIYPNDIVAIMRKADYYTILLKYIIDQKGKPTVKQLQQDPQANKVYLERNKMYDAIDNLGYQDMPKEEYENWLKSVDNQIKKAK